MPPPPKPDREKYCEVLDTHGRMWCNNYMTSTSLIATGTEVIVRHDNGEEHGIVLGHSNPLPGELIRYNVRFADRTISSWNQFEVSPA